MHMLLNMYSVSEFVISAGQRNLLRGGLDFSTMFSRHVTGKLTIGVPELRDLTWQFVLNFLKKKSKGDCASQIEEDMKKLAFSTNISLYFENDTI